MSEHRRARKSWRDINGILLLDKPSGITSNTALQRARRTYRARKAGHTGSLDSLATGLLPVCFGEATKVSGFLLDADKSYTSTFRLGQTTSTGDSQGEILEQRPVSVNQSEIEAAIAGFIGDIEQIPPMHSAIKQNGKRLYKLAHKGLEVERAPRAVRIDAMKLLDFREDTLEVEVTCSKGTYIRALAQDLGEALGCGAHVAALRRVNTGPFDLANAHELSDLEALTDADDTDFNALDALLIPMDSALDNLPDCRLSDVCAHHVCHGQAVTVPGAPSTGLVRLYRAEDEFIGIGKILDDGRVAPRRLLR